LKDAFAAHSVDDGTEIIYRRHASPAPSKDVFDRAQSGLGVERVEDSRRATRSAPPSEEAAGLIGRMLSRPCRRYGPLARIGSRSRREGQCRVTGRWLPRKPRLFRVRLVHSWQLILPRAPRGRSSRSAVHGGRTRICTIEAEVRYSSRRDCSGGEVGVVTRDTTSGRSRASVQPQDWQEVGVSALCGYGSRYRTPSCEAGPPRKSATIAHGAESSSRRPSRRGFRGLSTAIAGLRSGCHTLPLPTSCLVANRGYSIMRRSLSRHETCTISTSRNG